MRIWHRSVGPTLALFVLLLTAQLNGCGTLPEGTRGDISALINQQKAERAEAKGDFQLAAREYIRLAAASDAPAQAEYYLKAVSALTKGKHVAQARQVLKELDHIELLPHQSYQRNTLLAELALIERDAEAALSALRAGAPPDAPPALIIAAHRARAQAFSLMGNHLESVRERLALERFLTERDAVLANQQAIWGSLEALSPLALKSLRSAPPPDVLSGWLELAYIAKISQLEPSDLGDRILDWRKRYPLHPASDELVASLLARQQEFTYRPTRIALLLPLTGQFSRQAAAVRDGFIAAYYAHTDPSYKPAIRIYDVEDDPSHVNDVYQRAVNEGADFVIGPLSKPSVEALARTRRLSVPTLALNYTDADRRATENLFQFGLNPADEAVQVAERAWLDGYLRAVALVPEGEWGQRVLDAFRERWEILGGTLLEVQLYPSNDNDFSTPLQALLNIDNSETRWRSLERVLGTRLEYVPRRRQDIDFVFMGAFPRQARLIRPQLKFFYASELPIYATSHVFSGTLDTTADRDIDDVIFPDIPWILGRDPVYAAARAQIERYWPDSADQFKRLYALGYDAYNVTPHLNRLMSYSFERYAGATGSLQVSESRRLKRQLQWAQFRGGRPQPYAENLFSLEELP